MDPTAPWDRVDPLAEALHAMRTDGAFYSRSELSGAWNLQMPTMPGCVWFHAVTEGRFTLETDDAGSIEVAAGDFVLVPHGRGHLAYSDRNAEQALVTEVPQEMVSDRYSIMEYGTGGPLTRLICGVVRLETPFVSDLGSLLPPLIHLDAASTLKTEWISGTLRLLAAEVAVLRPGGETVLTRLADILVIQSIRTWLEANAHQQTGLLAAVNDPQIGRVLARVQRDPCASWTVESLASAAAMSRSGFSARFSALMDESPMHYVTRVRMREVQRILAGGSATVGELAARFGYRSEAAFGRAFKRCVGVSPGMVKRAGG